MPADPTRGEEPTQKEPPVAARSECTRKEHEEARNSTGEGLRMSSRAYSDVLDCQYSSQLTASIRPRAGIMRTLAGSTQHKGGITRTLTSTCPRTGIMRTLAGGTGHTGGIARTVTCGAAYRPLRSWTSSTRPRASIVETLSGSARDRPGSRSGQSEATSGTGMSAHKEACIVA